MSYYINSPVITGSGKWIKKIWNTYRWELFVVISIIALVICYFFTHQDKYDGLKYSLDPLKKKRKIVPKKHEKECKRIMEDKLGVKFESVRPSFLKNPKTGKNLELDMYNPELKLALEYQGIQHRKYTPFFHRQYTDYLDQVERDNYKKKRCMEEGIDLICVPDDIKYENLGKYIHNELVRLQRI